MGGNRFPKAIRIMGFVFLWLGASAHANGTSFYRPPPRTYGPTRAEFEGKNRRFLNVQIFRERALAENEQAVLLSAEYYVETQSGLKKITRRIWAQVEFPLGQGISGPLNELRINYVPESRLRETESDRASTLQGLRRFPTQIRRQLDGGTQLSSSVSALGYLANHTQSLNRDGTVTLFTQLAVDALGVRFLSLENQQALIGAQLLRSQGAAGFHWDINESYALEWTFGSWDQSRAQLGHSLRTQARDQEWATRLELFLNTPKGTFSLFAQLGLEHFYASTREPALQIGIQTQLDFADFFRRSRSLQKKFRAAFNPRRDPFDPENQDEDATGNDSENLEVPSPYFSAT
jgi:hypothetical protein